MKKKIDQRIKSMIENGIALNQRSLFVIVGDNGRDQVMNLHYILSKAQVSTRPSVLWCYKKELGFSSHKKKRMKDFKKKKQEGGLVDESDPFDIFVSSTDIRYTYYSETDRILGNTFGMCILQDFEAITPNTLARTIETVQGGGLVIMLLKSISSLKQLYTMAMDVHSRYRTEAHSDVVARFNERFLLSLSQCSSCLVMNDKLDVLPISSHNLQIEEVHARNDESLKEKLSKMKEELEESPIFSDLISMSKTIDQANCIKQCMDIIREKSLSTTVSLTAARGRGKSATLGLILAGAVGLKYSNIVVTSPSPENVKTLFEFVLKGLKKLGYEEHLDYDVAYNGSDALKCIVKISIKKNHRQIIQYIAPQDHASVSYAELVIIDEAAAIPLPLVKSMIAPCLVFMASTINGYEGTGRSLSLKLLSQLREQSRSATVSSEGRLLQGGSRHLKELELTEPIRYSAGDKIEKWLNDLLCLNCLSVPLNLSCGTPHPSQCDLYLVNRDTLFSFHKASELFLQKLMNLFVSSHYKNTPNDLQLLSDAPAHYLFVLLAPVTDSNSSALPDILCAVQVCLEGDISKDSVVKSLSRGKRASGDLIPWTISQQFQDNEFPSLSGARIVRIATHPDMQNMGYGMRAISLLEEYYGLSMDFEEEAIAEDFVRSEQEIQDSALGTEIIKPRKGLPPLLARLNEVKPPTLQWLGVSFGLTAGLFRFWKKAGYSPVYVRQTENELTGEHTTIVIKTLKNNSEIQDSWLIAYNEDFRKRFCSLLGFQLRSLSTILCMNVIEESFKSASNNNSFSDLSVFDLKRLESYADSMVDYHMVIDLLPSLAKSYFIQGGNTVISLSTIQRAILLAVGLQYKSMDEIAEELKIPTSQCMAMFVKIIRKISDYVKEGKMKSIQVEELSVQKSIKSDKSLSDKPGKRDIEDEEMWDPAASVDADLQDGANDVIAAMKEKQRQLINGLNFSQFEIKGDVEGFEKTSLQNVVTVKRVKGESEDVAGKLLSKLKETKKTAAAKLKSKKK